MITGDEYINRIDQLKSDVWMTGKRITEPLSTHPAFRGAIKSQAELYDLQNNLELSDLMAHEDKDTKITMGTSYMVPKTKADLEKRRKMVQVWARHTAGLMGRSPDYMNTVLASFVSSVHLLDHQKNCFPDHLLNFYKHAVENDLSFTHTFISPQNNRSSLVCLEEDTTNARVIKRLDDGLVIKGAKLLATQGGMTDEIIVFSAPGIQDSSHAFALSIPSDTPGVKFICRKSFTGKGGEFDSPLSSKFEEMDSIVVFDNVLVPWERVFFYDNIKISHDFYLKGNFVPLTLHQIVSRQVIKTEFILGIAQMIVDTINISEYQHVQSKVAEIIKGLESAKALLLASEFQAELNEYGVMLPDRTPLYIAVNMFQEAYPRFAEIIQLLGASGMVSLPEEAQFQSAIGGKLDHYLQGFEVKGKQRVQLFSLASDLCMSAFGSRQTLYERFFFGDPIRLSQIIYNSYSKEEPVCFVKEFINKKS